MNKFFLLPVLLLTLISSQSGIYFINVTSVNGDTLSLSSFQNKKIIVSPFNAADPDISLLHKLDSLQRSDTSLQVIAVPGNDLGGEGDDSALTNLRDSLSLSILMLRSSLLKKDAQENQHPLFKWLTDVNANMHFDADADTAGQLFIISKTGVLYSVLSPDVADDVLTQVLEQDVEE